MMKPISILMLILTLTLGCNQSNAKKQDDAAMQKSDQSIRLVHDEANLKVDVFFGTDLFTSYRYTDAYYKPVLYPLITASGKSLTRGFPIDPMPGERVDHPHHVGHWLNYGDVNGLDFWNHSDAIPAEKKDGYGTIFHKSVSLNEAKAALSVVAEWKAPNGTVLIEEHTTFTFSELDNHRIIDRETTLHAQTDVSLADNKEGFVAVRVTRALEHPSKKPEIFTDANGIPSEVKVLNNEGVTGNYLSSNGITGEAVWGTRGVWMALNGTLDGEAVAITIYDHPNNLGYPTYWHARGYGLFAANPLGQKVFSKGANELNAAIAANESLTFKYRIVVSNGAAIDNIAAEQFKSF
ncbi:MAG: PmoA family protein [Flavobacteriaceae bacterium]